MVKELAATSEDLSLIPGIHMVEREDQLMSDVSQSSHVCCDTCAHTQLNVKKNVNSVDSILE